MKNREYLISQLSGECLIDDCGSSYEATVFNSISCPYLLGDKRAFCYGLDCNEVTRDMCFECKEEWLDSEVDL